MLTSARLAKAARSATSMSGVKRSAGAAAGASPPSKKIHPMFTGGLKDTAGNFLPSPPTLIHYLHLDPFASSSTLPTPAPTEPATSPTSPTSPATSTTKPPTSPSKANGTKASIPIVFYDLDGTLIKTRSGNKFPSSRDDWAWWHASVPAKLKKEVEEGKHLIVISNQGDAREKIRREWRAKLPLIAAKLPNGVPLRILAALNKYDIFRKPNVGMYEVVEGIYREQGHAIDLEHSVFVGDAAGRLGGKGKAKDHDNTDYKFALNVGLKFVTPEEHFLGNDRPAYPDPPTGFNPRKFGDLAALPPIVPSNTPITRHTTEIVLFVGPPASGKTSFFRRYFEGEGYEHINQDTLGRREKCLSVAEDALKSGKSVVIDNTNRNKETRAYWINLATKLHLPIRLFHFLCPPELARHNNVYRAIYAPPDEPKRDLLPFIAFANYTSQFQQPELKEGFDEIRGVNFVWKGTEEQRRKWDLWMLEPK